MARRKTHEEFSKEVRGLFGNEYNFLSEYKNKRTRVKLEHKQCGYEWDVFPQSLFRSKGCPLCNGGARLSNEEFSDKVKKLGNDEYESVSKYTNMHKRITLKHKTCGHVWDLVPYAFIQGSRCPSCAYESKGRKLSKPLDVFVKELKVASKGEYTLVGDYINTHAKTTFRHNECGTEWDTKPYLMLGGGGCVTCSGSSGEKRVLRYLKSKAIEHKMEYTIDECKYIRPLPFDFAVFEEGKLLCLIEYEGQQHYDSVEFWGGAENLKRIQLRDEIKRTYCKEKGIPLIEIPYWDFENIDMILSEEIGKLKQLVVTV